MRSTRTGPPCDQDEEIVGLPLPLLAERLRRSDGLFRGDTGELVKILGGEVREQWHAAQELHPLDGRETREARLLGLPILPIRVDRLPE